MHIRSLCSSLVFTPTFSPSQAIALCDCWPCSQFQLTRHYKGFPCQRWCEWVSAGLLSCCSHSSFFNLQSEARRTVYHDCMKIVLDDEWLHAMEHGKRMTGPDGCKYNVFPFLLQYQADLQEFAMITQTRGHRGMCPCPKCLIPAELVTSPDLDDHRTAPRRSQSDMIQLLEANITKAKCKELGAWKAPSALFAATSDVYECAAVDPLHQFDLGVVPYVTQAVQQLIDATEADTKGKLEELRLRTSTWMPPYHALEARTVSLLAIDPKMQKSLKAHEWRSVTRRSSDLASMHR
ncbi:hypothetical protein BCR44DRAFT_1216978 [Catenaria anguillulae PL171]|uniref:Transposase-associated domain-containing protein n=1 Tax=Catenaria anguillulae PL171 TaxID=765915 RepID=A0A1Y2HZ37_9FUNG|nr:hypothetical protein BCR44DRAFT_1216978 [Catenaria anguillulae PL171]